MKNDTGHLLESMRAAPQFDGVTIFDVHDPGTGQRAVALALVDRGAGTIGAGMVISPRDCYQLAESLMNAADAVRAAHEQARAMQ